MLAVSEAVSAPVGLGVITMQSDNFQQFKEVCAAAVLACIGRSKGVGRC